MKYKSDKGILKDVINQTKDSSIKSILFNLKLVPTFSLIIDATYTPIKTYLSGEYPTLTEDEITSLIVAATCQFVFQSYDRIKDSQGLKNYLEEHNLTDKVSKTKEAITKLIKIGGDVLKDVGYTAATVSGILGFGFLLHPMMDGINELMMRNSDFSIDNIFRYVVMGVAFKGSLVLEQFIRNLINRYEQNKVKMTKQSDIESDEEIVDETFLSEKEIKSLIDSVLLH